MTMTKKNIQFVKRHEKNGMTYGYFVKLKGHECREYINYECGRTVVKEYKAEWLPASVRTFLKEHDEEIFAEEIWNDDEFITYIAEA